jgi:hypothetical protein
MPILNPQDTPIFIISRDRLEPLLALVEWLEKANCTNIVILDNASTYPPLVKYLDSCKYRVERYKKNWGHLVAQKARLIRQAARAGYYVITDPDIIPKASCPKDALEYFYRLLNQYPQVVKVGFGLCIDDLPDAYEHKQHVLTWEGQFWENEVSPGVFAAPIDTTFALYRPGVEFSRTPSIRTGEPYVARHLPWYSVSDALSAEEEYYRGHLRADVSNWNQEKLPLWLVRMIEGVGKRED